MRILLQHSQDLLPLQRKAPCQDHPHIAAAQNHDLAAQPPMMEIDHFLCLPGGEDPRRACPGNGERAHRPLSAARRQDQPFKADFFHTAFAGQDRGLFFCHCQYFLPWQKAHTSLRQTFRQSLHIGGAGQLTSKGREPKALVNTLGENAARIRQAVCQQNIPAAGVPRGTGGGNPRSPRADNQQLSSFHGCPPGSPSPGRPS